MTADRVGPLEGHAAGHTVTVVVVCGFIGCDWRMEIGTAPLEAHHAYLDHLDVHDPDHISYYEAEHDAEVARALAHDKLPGRVGLYAGDTAEQIAADQARVDRFMAGGNDA